MLFEDANGKSRPLFFFLRRQPPLLSLFSPSEKKKKKTPLLLSRSLRPLSLPSSLHPSTNHQALSKKSDDASRRVSSSHLGPAPVPRFSRKAVADAAAWAGNISSSVLIIFVNKYLMGRKGYDFHYGERSVFFCCCFWMERRGGGGEREGEKTWGERERERATRREGDGTREQKKGKTKLQKKRLSFTPFFPRHPPPHTKKQRQPSAPSTTWPAPPRPWPSTPRPAPSASACPRSTCCSSRSRPTRRSSRSTCR